MTGTSSAYSIYLILKQNIFLLEKWRGRGLLAPAAPPSLIIAGGKASGRFAGRIVYTAKLCRLNSNRIQGIHLIQHLQGRDQTRTYLLISDSHICVSWTTIKRNLVSKCFGFITNLKNPSSVKLAWKEGQTPYDPNTTYSKENDVSYSFWR